MNNLETKYGWLSAPQAYVSLKHEVDKVIVFERAGVLFIFNFHPTQSFSDYRVGVKESGEYSVVLSSDENEFGGHERVDTSITHFTTPMECNNRKNFLQTSFRFVLFLLLCYRSFLILLFEIRKIGLYPEQDLSCSGKALT